MTVRGESPLASLKESIEHGVIFMRKRKVLSTAVAMWVGMAIAVIAFWIPQVRQSFADREQIEAKTTEYEQLKASVDALSRLDRTDIETTLPITQTALPFEKPVLPLLYSIDRLAREAQVTVSNFQVSPGSLSTQSARQESKMESTLAKGVLALPLQMDVSGSFENMNEFFRLLDSIVPLMHVSGIEFAVQGASSASGSAQFQATVDLSTLYSDALPPDSGTQSGPYVMSAAERTLIEELRKAYDVRVQDELIGGQVPVATSSGGRNLFGNN